MRQKLINGAVLVFFSTVSVLAFSMPNKHLSELNSKFPYGLLGEDHGILSVNDLRINACESKPKPFNPEHPSYYPYQYWQCFESKNISVNCDSSGVPDEHEGVLGLVVVKASINQNQHEYTERRLWPIRDCKDFIKETAAVLKGTRYACISGSFLAKNTSSEYGESGTQSTNWVFERLKTKKGCEGHDCRLTQKHKKNGC